MAFEHDDFIRLRRRIETLAVLSQLPIPALEDLEGEERKIIKERVKIFKIACQGVIGLYRKPSAETEIKKDDLGKLQEKINGIMAKMGEALSLANILHSPPFAMTDAQRTEIEAKIDGIKTSVLADLSGIN